MADNVYALLQQAWAVSKTSDANMYGVEVAIVTNVQDPEKQGRVKICFPRLPGKPESDWARVAQPSAGPGRGFYWLPEVNDEVLVAFERGQTNRPFVIGAVWNGKDKPMKDAYTDENTTRMIQTKSGHQIVLDDKSGEEKMTFADGSGKRTLTFDVKEKKFLVEAKEGDVEIHAEKKIVLQCEDLEIKTKKTGKVEIGSTFDLKVAQKASFKAGPQLNLKAGKVNLNPPSLSIEALVTAAEEAVQKAAAASAEAAQEQQQQQQAAGSSSSAASAAGPATVPTSTPAPAVGVAGGSAAAQARQKAGAAAPAGSAWTTAKAGQGGGSAAASPASGAAPAAVVATDQLDVQLVDGAGKAMEGIDVQATLPGGERRTGRTDASGHFKLTGLNSQGNAKFELTGVQVRKSTDPAASGRIRYVDGGVQVAIGALTVVELPQKTTYVLEVEDALFRTDSAVLLPEGQDPTSVDKKGKLKAVTGPGVIATALRYFDEHPENLVLVAGHTDTVGTADYNLALSELRGGCVQAVLTGDRDGFGALANQRHKVKDYQQILAWVARTNGWSCDPGPIDGDHADQTSKAVRGFKSAWNQDHSAAAPLDASSGAVDAETWKAFFDVYETALQGELGSSADGVQQLRRKLRFMTPNPVGCGEFHPIDHLGRDNYESQTNRRVEILFFDAAELPDMGCHASRCDPSHCQVYDLDRYRRQHFPPLINAKFWSSGWEADQVQENQSNRMILNAPGLPAGTPLDFEVLQKDNAGGADIQVGTLTVTSTADHGESSWSSWFTYDRNDIRKGHDFRFVFVIRGGGRVVRSASATIFHPNQLQLMLVDGEDKLLVQRPYRLEIDGQALRDKTDSQGTLLENIRAGATEARLIVGDDQPLWTVPVKLIPMQGADTVVGAQMRLNNLGLCGPEAVHGNLDPQTERALQRFQQLHGIKVTGRLDADTVAKLRQVYGS